jgi:hypothetical protein
MAATKLPDGSVVMRPSGQRAYPTGGGTTVTRPAQAKGGTAKRAAAVRVPQPGRKAVSRDAYRS